MWHYYKMYGLKVKSIYDLCHEEVDHEHRDVDVEVLEEDIPEIQEALIHTKQLTASQDGIRFKDERIGEIYVGQGSRIVINPLEGVSISMLRRYVLNAGMSIIMHQRGLLPFHGSSVLTKDGKTLLILGDSTAGKSTLAKGFYENGGSLLADDLSCIQVSKPISVIPGVPEQKLWENVVKGAQTAYQQVEEIIDQPTKHLVSGGIPFCEEIKPLDGIVYLLTKDQIKTIKEETVDFSSRLNILVKQTFNYGFLPFMGLQKAHFALLSQLLKIPMIKIERPLAVDTIDDQISILKEAFL